MVQINKSLEPGSSLPPLELSVYRSPKDAETILAYATYPVVVRGNRAIWPCIIPFGTTVQHAYKRAMAFGQLHGVAIKVNDPNRLFPAEDRT
jgi:hypothetical protein